MRHRSRLVEVLYRAETGPILDEADFERRLVAPTIKRLVKHYDIHCDRSTLVPFNDDLADRVFEAGLDFASEVGMYCQTTSRRIVWSRRELEEGLRFSPGAVTMGAGNDAVVCAARRPDDARRVTVVGGAYGNPVPEDQFVPIMLSYAQEPVVDVIENATLETVYGRPIKADSPWEILGGWREAELSFEVIGRAGRPGMCIGCVETSPTALAEMSASSWGGFRPTDWHHVATVSEFKTNFDLLNKVAHTVRIGGVMESYYNPIYGGYVGGAEGVAVAIAAALILLNQINMADTCCTRPDHPFLGSNTTAELLWAMSVGMQALSRNTQLLVGALVGPAGGPGTKTLLYEVAAFSAAIVSSGAAMIQAAHTAGGSIPRHISGLEAKLCGEVTRAVAGMPREQANELAGRLYSRFEPDHATRPIGREFAEVYNLDTVEPTPEWRGQYEEVWNELVTLGIPLDWQPSVRSKRAATRASSHSGLPA